MQSIFETILSKTYIFVNYSLIAITLCFVAYYVISFIGKQFYKGLVSSDGKAVLITGCDTGFGNRLAQRLCQMGFRVYATVLSPYSKGAELLRTEFADKAVILQMNVTNEAEVNEVYEEVRKDLEASGRTLWAVVNNAAVFWPTPLEWGTEDMYKDVLEINLMGTIRVSRVFLPLIRAASGRVVNMASVCGRAAVYPWGVYNITKFGVVAFTESLRREVNKFNVKAISIEPGMFRTPLLNRDLFIRKLDEFWNQSTEEVKKAYESPEPAKKYLNELLDNFPTEENIDLVVDVQIDAIASKYPNIIYRPMGWTFSFLLYANMLLPSLVDKMMKN